MKSRKWIIIAAILLAVPVLAGLGFRFYGIPRFANSLITKHLRPILGENASIQSAKINLSGLTLNKLIYRESNSNLKLNVEKVRLNLKPLNIFIYGLSPLNLIDEIYIDNWVLDYGGTQDSVHVDRTDRESGGKLKFPWDAVKSLPSIQRINLAEGRVEFNPIRLKRIYGWLDFSLKDSVEFDFSAEALADTANLRVGGMLFVQEETADFQIKLDETGIPDDLEPASGCHFTDGKAALELKGRFVDDSFTLEGKAVLSDISLNYDDSYRLDYGELSAVFSENNILISGGAELLGQKVIWRGSLKGFFEPVMNLLVESRRLNLSEVLQYIEPAIEAQGIIDLDIKFKGTPGKPEISFKAASPEVIYAEFRFENTRIAGRFEGWDVNLESFSFDTFGGSVWGKGICRQADKKTLLNLTVDYAGKPSLSEIFSDIGELPLDSLIMTAVVEGEPSNPSIKGQYSINPSIEVNRLKGDFNYMNSHLEFLEASGAGDSVGIVVDWCGKKPIFSIVGKNIHLAAEPGLLPDMFNDRTLNVQIKAGGNFEDFSLLFNASGKRVDVNLNGRISRSGILKFLGDYELIVDNSLGERGDIAFRVIRDTLLLDNFTFGSDLYAWGSLDLKRMRINDFHAKAEEFPLDSLLLYYGYENWENLEGDLKFEVRAEGDVLSPKSELSLYLSRGKLHGTPGYWASLAGDLQEKKFQLLRFDFGNGGRTLFNARGSIDLVSGEMDFRSQLDDVDADLLINAVCGKRGALTGSGRFSIKASGTLQEPQIQSDFWFEKGRLCKIPFDQVAGNFEIVSDQKSTRRLNVPSLRLFKHDGYDLGLKGVIPLNDEEIELVFNGEGNLLSILPFLEGAFTNGYGNVNAELKVGGRKDSPQLKEGKVTITGGALELNEITDRIHDLELEAELEGDFIHVQRLTGKVEKTPFTITTIPSVSSSEVPLEPWIIGSLGLKLGIITLTTGDEGLEVNIPSFTDPDETVLLKAEGRSSGETAYIAGPEEHPVVRCKLIARDGVIIYPPPGGKGPTKKRNSFQKLLRRIDWDLEVVPDRGNTYRRDISGLPGMALLKDISRVTVDMNIDKQIEGLKVSGIIEDSLALSGTLVSTRGTMHLLDLDFRVGEFQVEFEPAQKLPWVQGYATTTTEDTLGRNIIITLRAAHVDPETGEKSYRARWDDFTFILESEMGESQEQILSYLGYAPETFGGRVTDASIQVVNKAVFGDWLGSIEREIKSILGVDYIDINPAVAQNLLEQNLFAQSPDDTTIVDWRTRYLRRSRFTLGKYLTDDLFLTYAGRFESGESPYDRRRRLGMIHTWNLEYRLPTKGSNLLAILGYEYDNLEQKYDRRISISYRFNF